MNFIHDILSRIIRVIPDVPITQGKKSQIDKLNSGHPIDTKYTL